jgi:hypothetical protein
VVVSVCGLRGDVALFYFYLRRFSLWFRDQVSQLQVLNMLYVYDKNRLDVFCGPLFTLDIELLPLLPFDVFEINKIQGPLIPEVCGKTDTRTKFTTFQVSIAQHSGTRRSTFISARIETAINRRKIQLFLHYGLKRCEYLRLSKHPLVFSTSTSFW